MRRIATLDLWPEIRRRAKIANRRMAAVAYVTSEAQLKFGAGDVLVVDASNEAIKCGATSAKILKAAHVRGARLFNCPGLHAKVLLLDGVAIVGSANLSAASVSRKIEAALISDDTSIARSVESVIRQLARQSTEIDNRFLRRIAKIEVAWRRPESSRAKGISLDPGRLPSMPDWGGRPQGRIVKKRATRSLEEILAGKRIRLDRPSRVLFKGRTFAFTGKFSYGAQRKCISATASRGGRAAKWNKITRDVDVLVIGEKGNPQYLWDSYGTKIAMADDLRREFGKPLIIHETLWSRSL